MDKVLSSKQALQNQQDTLAENLQSLVDKERFYMKTVAEFKEVFISFYNLIKLKKYFNLRNVEKIKN